jgi:hypothetical protein
VVWHHQATRHLALAPLESAASAAVAAGRTGCAILTHLNDWGCWVLVPDLPGFHDLSAPLHGTDAALPELNVEQAVPVGDAARDLVGFFIVWRHVMPVSGGAVFGTWRVWC